MNEGSSEQGLASGTAETDRVESDEPTDEVEESRPGSTETENYEETRTQLVDRAALEAGSAIQSSLVTLGYVAFDQGSADNATSELMVSPELRARFRRDTYVGIR